MANKLYKGKYRGKTIRLQQWDYRWTGAYFITICTKNRIHYFGEVEEKKMNLSRVGVLADIFWYEMKHHAINISLGNFVVMPNHIHGILVLHGAEINDGRPAPIGRNSFQNQGKNSVSSMVGGYKAAVTKHANRLGFDFAWQRNYYEHIIRDERAFWNISNYITNNPLKWGEDKFYR